MKSTRLAACMTLGAMFLAGQWLSTPVRADGGDLPDEVRALMAKERARNFKSAEDKAQQGTANTKDSSGGKKNGPTIARKGVVGGCDMQVGNTASRPGTMNAKPQPVIITGPVVQVCK